MRDLLLAARSMARQPVLFGTAVLLLGSGIGAATVLFSIVDALLLRTLPVREPERLVRLVEVKPNIGPRSDFPWPVLRNIQERSTTLEDVFGWMPADVSFEDGGVAERIRIETVSGGLFPSLGVAAALGRAIGPEDDRPESPPVAVLSHNFWRRRFSADPRVLGRTIRLQGRTFTVVGVLPESFPGLSIDTSPDVRVSIQQAPISATDPEFRKVIQRFFSIGGRLRTGATPEQARQEIDGLYKVGLEEAARRRPEWGSWMAPAGLEVERLGRGTSMLRDQFGRASVVLLAGAGFLLAMVCASVAALLLSRWAARRNERALRLALGATRTRLARLTLSESVLLTAGALVFGLLLATAALPLLVGAIPPVRDFDATSLPLALRLRLDWRVFGFAAALGLLTTLGVGLLPLFQSGGYDLQPLLRSSRSPRTGFVQPSLIAVQVALSTVLVAGSGMLVRTFFQLRDLHPGFDQARVVSFSLDPDLGGYTSTDSLSLQRRLLDGARALPGVDSAALSGRGVMRGTGLKTTIAPQGERSAASDFLNSSLHVVTPEYFATMGIPLLAGRNFAVAETSPTGAPRPVIVNRAFVRRFCPEGSPLGRRFGVSLDKPAGAEYEIIGVAGDAKYRSLREPVPPTLYSRWSPDPGRVPSFLLLVRTRQRPETVIEPVRSLLHDIDPRLPFFEIRTLAEEVDASLWRERLLASLSLGFAVLAGLLASAGLYGLLANFVAQRAGEIGVRTALGAAPRHIFSLVASRAAVPCLTGIALGLLAAYLSARSMTPLLYGAGSLSAAALAGASVLVASLLALLGPAWRAVRLDPAITLRAE